MENNVNIEKKVQRGEISWAYINFVFEILLTIGLCLIVIPPYSWFYKVIACIVFVFTLGWLYLDNAWFQNKLLRFKINSENKWRKI